MKRSGWVVVALWSVLPVTARAQGLLGPPIGRPVGPHAAFHHHSPPFALNAPRVTVFRSLAGGYLAGYPFSPAYAGFVPWGASPFDGGLGLYGLTPLWMPSVVVAPPINGLDENPVPPAAAPVPRGRGGLMPGSKAGRFRPVGPQDRERAKLPVGVEPAPPVRPAAPPLPPDPRDEQADLLRFGRQAFATGAYGRAADLFRRAVAAVPESASPYFLLAQAQIALGKYAEAVAAIHQGMDRLPDWPTIGTPLLALYEGNGAAFSDHLRELDAAAAERPADPTLLFLQAYVRWFDGRRAEARELFRRVRDRVTRPEVIDRFLRAEPGA
jgi:Tetratricopeptide repeat